MKKIIPLLLLVLAAGLLAFKNTRPAAPAKPNILYLVADDAGRDMSAYGVKWVNTPAFDRIAREGILFNNGYTPNAKCAPSRAVMLTGRNPWQLDAGMNHVNYFPNYFKTYPEALSDNGYFVGKTGKGWGPGVALHSDGSDRNVLVKNYDALTTAPPAKYISNNDYAANFADFVKKADGKPWCFWIGFIEPHRAYEYGAGIKKGGKKPEMIDRVPAYFPDSLTVRTDMLDYAYEIEYLDSHVARVLKTLEENGQLENTLIVYTSDHGMPFPRVKGNAYENANHVPFAAMWKNGIKNPGRKIDDYVNMTDLAPTFLDAAGVSTQQSGMHPMIGKSLLSLFNSTKSGWIEEDRKFQLVGQERHDYGRPHDVGYPIRGMHKNNMLYVKNYENDRWPACNPETGYLNTDGSPTKTLILNNRRNGVDKTYWDMSFGKRPTEELYDLKKDPDCVVNLAALPKYQATKKSMEKEMEAKLLAQGDLRMMGFGHIYEQYPFSQDVNGFYERYMKGEKIPTGWVNDSDYEKGPIED